MATNLENTEKYEPAGCQPHFKGDIGFNRPPACSRRRRGGRGGKPSGLGAPWAWTACAQGMWPMSSVQLTRATRLTAATLNIMSNDVHGSVGSCEHNAVEQHSRRHILVQQTMCGMFALVCKPIHKHMFNIHTTSQDLACVIAVDSFLVLPARKNRPCNDMACALRCQASGLAIM